MNMAPRLQLEKVAWRWVETVRPEEIGQEHVELAYRVNLPACMMGACRYKNKFLNVILLYHAPVTFVFTLASRPSFQKYLFAVNDRCAALNNRLDTVICKATQLT